MSKETSLHSVLPFNLLDANSFNIALYEMILTLIQTFLLAYRLADIWSRKTLMIRLVSLMKNRCFLFAFKCPQLVEKS